MKADIHPDYQETDIVCACGAVYHTRSTKRDIRIGICAACHPFFTGEQKFVDTAGRVEKFLPSRDASPISNARCRSRCFRQTKMKIETRSSRFAPAPAEARPQFSRLICIGCTITMPSQPD